MQGCLELLNRPFYWWLDLTILFSTKTVCIFEHDEYTFLGNPVDIQWLSFINKWHFTGNVPQAQFTSCLKQNLLLSWWSPSVHPWLQLPASPQTQRSCQGRGSFQCHFSEKRKRNWTKKYVNKPEGEKNKTKQKAYLPGYCCYFDLV